MIKATVNMSKFMPIQREMAMKITNTADKYQATLTLEHKGIVLNLKSMIGLLSQSIPKDGIMKMMGSFTILRLASMVGMANINFTKEELLKMNKQLNRIRKHKSLR